MEDEANFQYTREAVSMGVSLFRPLCLTSSTVPSMLSPRQAIVESRKQQLDLFSKQRGKPICWFTKTSIGHLSVPDRSEV
jgi:hypothetical protein